MDIYSKEKRSRLMAAVRSRHNKSTEQRLAALFRAAGIHGWRRGQRLPGSPDFVFSERRIAVFVDGCFWHGCPHHYKVPKTNVRFWKNKIEANRSRDLRVRSTLRKLGWRVVRIWEHSMRHAPSSFLHRLARALAQDLPSGENGARLLRCRTNNKWDKDRGKEPQRRIANYCWFRNGSDFTCDLMNDVHLTNEHKRKARKE